MFLCFSLNDLIVGQHRDTRRPASDDPAEDNVEVKMIPGLAMNRKKREAALVTKLFIRQDMDAHADMVGETMSRLRLKVHN